MTDTAKQPAAVPDIDNPMQYIDTTEPRQLEAHHEVEQYISLAYRCILEKCPRSAERTLAIRKLQEARMWANAAIVFDGRTYAL
jgi:hypothetical protein